MSALRMHLGLPEGDGWSGDGGELREKREGEREGRRGGSKLTLAVVPRRSFQSQPLSPFFFSYINSRPRMLLVLSSHHFDAFLLSRSKLTSPSHLLSLSPPPDCSDTLDNGGGLTATSTNCNAACSGDSSETCGG